MSYAVLGSIDPLIVTSSDGWDLPQTASLVLLLSDGTAGANQVMQQGAVPLRQKGIAGDIIEDADLTAIRAYYLSKEEVAFTGSDDGVTTMVRVFDLTTNSDHVGIWHFRATLVESDTAADTAGVGQVRAGLDTTLAADPALGATNLKVTSVTTVVAGAFIRLGPAGAAATAVNSEVVRVLVVGTTGGGGTGLDIETDIGGGTGLDYASADEVKTVTGTLLSTPARAGAVNVKVDSVTGLIVTDAIRIGYLDHYETRVLTAVGSAGVSGTGLTFTTPLAHDHSLDEWVIEVET